MAGRPHGLDGRISFREGNSATGLGWYCSFECLSEGIEEMRASAMALSAIALGLSERMETHWKPFAANRGEPRQSEDTLIRTISGQNYWRRRPAKL